jgi:hypothetical protein
MNWDGWRVFRVVDRRGDFLWWEVRDDREGATCSLSDFRDGAWLGLTDADKARSLKRVAKVTP